MIQRDNKCGSSKKTKAQQLSNTKELSFAHLHLDKSEKCTFASDLPASLSLESLSTAAHCLHIESNLILQYWLIGDSSSTLNHGHNKRLTEHWSPSSSVCVHHKLLTDNIWLSTKFIRTDARAAVEIYIHCQIQKRHVDEIFQRLNSVADTWTTGCKPETHEGVEALWLWGRSPLLGHCLLFTLRCHTL